MKYAATLEEQLKQLESDEQMLAFAESRKRLSGDRYRPSYHFVNPEREMGDPNGLCCWQGRYHLFYISYPPNSEYQCRCHAVSDDLVHWKDLPIAIYPDIEERCASGNIIVEEDRVIHMYHGMGAGNMIAVSGDPLLLNWEKIPGNPVIPLNEVDETGRPYRVFDPCIWKEKDGYYSLSGSYWDTKLMDNCRMVQHLFFSQDLERWTYHGSFVEGDIFTAPGEDGAVPHFWPIGDKHILVFASHERGSQYLLGDYDELHHRFRPFAHGRFNFWKIWPGSVHAPSCTPDGEGGVYLIHNINQGRPWEDWNHIMSLVSRLTLHDDNTLGIEPVQAVESLRTNHKQVGETVLPPNREVVLEGIEGDTMELAAEIDLKEAREVCLNVLRSPNREEVTAIKFFAQYRPLGRHGPMGEEMHEQERKRGRKFRQDALVLDNSRSSLLPDVFGRPPEVAPFDLADGEILKLRIFIDRSVVEVYANGRQCVALRVYPEREDSLGVSIRAQGRDARLVSLDAWQMKGIW